MSDLIREDFEKWYVDKWYEWRLHQGYDPVSKQEMLQNIVLMRCEEKYENGKDYLNHAWEGWQAAIASMQGEAKFNATTDADRLRSVARGMSYNDMSESTWKHVILEIAMRLDTGGYNANDSAAKIAEQDARIKELESQLVSTDQLSVHDIRIGMSALLQCEVSEIEAMDNRCYDESYQAVQRVIEAISLSVKQEKLFGNEIYQAAANHFEQKIKELEQQLEVARKDAIPVEKINKVFEDWIKTSSSYGFSGDAENYDQLRKDILSCAHL